MNTTGTIETRRPPRSLGTVPPSTNVKVAETTAGLFDCGLDLTLVLDFDPREPQIKERECSPLLWRPLLRLAGTLVQGWDN